MNKLTFYFSLCVKIPADEVKMRNLKTEEVKLFNQIEEKDRGNWIVNSYDEIIHDGEMEVHDVSFEEEEEEE